MRRAFLRAASAFVLALCAINTAFSEKQASPIVFYHEEKGAKGLEQLKRDFDFDEYVAAGKDEFEQMNLLKRWTYDTVTYGGAKKYIDLRNGLTILQKAKKGEVFWCNNIGAVYMQCTLAMGWTSRYVFLRNSKAESHIANDIWSNTYRKWVMIDATWNIHIEKDGIPLSLVEIRDEWLKNDGADLVYVYGAGDNEKRFTKSMLPIKRDDNFLYRLWPVTVEWISFMNRVAIVGRNNFFSVGDGSGAAIWDPIYALKNAPNSKDVPWEFDRYPRPPIEDLFHEINKVELKVEPAPGRKDALALTMDAFSNGNYAPNFKTYEYRIDSGPWTAAPASTTVEVKAGTHTVEARIRNDFDSVGFATSAQATVKGDPLGFLFFWRRGNGAKRIAEKTNAK